VVYASSPEIRTFEVFLGFIPQEVLHVLAYECRCVVAACIEAVDHRWRLSEQILNAIPRRRRCFFCALAFANLAPRADHLGRSTLFVADQLLSVVYPAIGAVLPEKPVLGRMTAFLEQPDRLGFYCG